MRLKHIALFSASAILSLSALAAPQSGPDVVEVRANQPQQVQMAPFIYDRAQGEYALEDGRRLNVTGRDRSLYADLGDGPIELIHVGKNRFVAVGKDVRLRFENNSRVVESVFVSEAGGREVASTQR